MATLRLGDTAPNFEAETTLGHIKFYDWLGDSWGVLFSHPSDFTPVCTTELGTVANYYPEFQKRNTKVIALSVDADDTFTVRSVFIISPDKKVKLILTYPASTGRNFDELLRVIDSLQLTANYSVATPANWKDGEDVVISPSIKDEDIPSKFPKGFTGIKPYLRMTPQPNK